LRWWPAPFGVWLPRPPPPKSIDRLDPGEERPALQTVRADEVEHRDEAATLFAHAGSPKSLTLRVWTWAVGTGSRLAVGICRRI